MSSYFNDIFIKNIDIWGFTMIYVSLYEYLYKSFETLNEYQMRFIDKIKYIIIHFLYENPITLIDTSSLINELTNLNKVIEQFDIDNPSVNTDDTGGNNKNKNKNIKNKSKRLKKHNIGTRKQKYN
jgi:hypothetical protein